MSPAYPLKLNSTGGTVEVSSAEQLGDWLVTLWQRRWQLNSIIDADGVVLPAEQLLQAALLDFYGPERFLLIWK
ncbi:MAG: hypothetical protein JWQ08_2549 [Deinococcus sp.]|nr:hypothetical protein [Deinococcus sp.]